VKEAERLLLAQLQDKNKDLKPALNQLASLYNDTRRYDQALGCLRELIAIEPELEQKAACVLAMGATAEKKRDFEAAVRFYREALAMEPIRNDVWFFIHNNLGYSLNMLGHFAEGEKCCRAAIDINPSRPNGHKNLGIALVGQGHYHQAARCFVTATNSNAGDARSFGLLKDLLQQHPELEFAFQKQFARCEEAVKFAAAAIQRARAGKPLKILVGTNESKWQEMCLYLLRAMTGGAVEIDTQTGLAGFVEKACAETFDLGFLTPNFLFPEQAVSAERDPWANAVHAVRSIEGNRHMLLILAGVAEDVEKHAQTCREAGADAVLEMSFNVDSLVDVTRRVLAQTAEQNDAEAQNNLWACYANGQGVARDYIEAVKWFRKAAEQEYAEAQWNLGVCYYVGRGIAMDEAEAAKWFRKAADQNFALAQLYLGNCTCFGQGVAKDYAEAAKWYRRAAEQNEAQAQYHLGLCYANGQGVAKDYVEAVKWYRKAAECGATNALIPLAWILATTKNSAIRDGADAVVFAEKAVTATSRKKPADLDTLAAAYAEAGQFNKAVRTEQEAIALSQTAAEKNDYTARLKLFKAHVSYRAKD
jgi:TPR repeat protein